jgi:hypothetical protein
MFQTRSNSFLCKDAKKAAARYGVTENSFPFFWSAFTLVFLIWFDLVRHGDRRPSSPKEEKGGIMIFLHENKLLIDLDRNKALKNNSG